MQDRFGATCVAVLRPTALAEFGDGDCLRVALHLRLPVKVADGLPVPIDVSAQNPVVGSAFQTFRIRTVRDDGEGCQPFTAIDEPYDENFDPPFFGLYGVGDDGLREHIADFVTYAAAVSLVCKLAPGVHFPDTPHS